MELFRVELRDSTRLSEASHGVASGLTTSVPGLAENMWDCPRSGEPAKDICWTLACEGYLTLHLGDLGPMTVVVPLLCARHRHAKRAYSCKSGIVTLQHTNVD